MAPTLETEVLVIGGGATGAGVAWDCALRGYDTILAERKDIATALSISVRTVRSHLDRIREKTGCRRRPDLTRLAIETGIGREDARL